MGSISRRSFAAGLLAAAAGCASRGSPASGRSRSRADLITREEIQATSYNNLYDLVQALRGNWLQSRGPDTILGTPGEVQVRLDDTRLGGVQTLRNISPIDVASIQWVDPVSASGRWGLGHGHGAIHVITRTR